MSNRPYEVAHELEKAVRESEQFEELQAIYQELYNDETSKKMFENFRDIQLNLQQKQMSGQPISDDEIQYAQKLVQLVQQNDKISRLMEAEQKMSLFINELNKIIMKPLEELYGFGPER